MRWHLTRKGLFVLTRDKTDKTTEQISECDKYKVCELRAIIRGPKAHGRVFLRSATEQEGNRQTAHDQVSECVVSELVVQQ